MFSDFKSYNKNVKLAMISSIFIMSSNGLLMSTIFSIFVKAIGGTDVLLGLVSFFGGIVLLLVLIPAGLLTDKMNRKYSLRFGSVFLFVGFVLFYLSNNILEIFISYGIINIGNGFIRPSREALIADSVMTNRREKIYGEIFFIQMTSNALGPLFAVFMFLIIGNNWAISTLKQVILVGVIALIIGIMILSLMDDKYSLGLESESDYVQKGTDNNKKPGKNQKIIQIIKENNIPLFIVALGVVIGIGAGMTVRFFPIFFKELYNLPPTVLNFMYFLNFILTGLIGILLAKSVKYIGKIESIILVQLIAIVCLVIIAMIPPLVIVIPIFLFRGAFMNSSQPVKNAIVMDLVRKKNRGIFQSLELLSQNFFWSLSAGVGGFLLEYYNFPVLYITTAIIYVAGTVPFFLIRKKIKNNYGIKVKT